MICCFFGDSLTLGTGDIQLLGWAGRVVQKIWAEGRDITSYNMGVRANTSPLVLERWYDETVSRTQVGGELKLIFSVGVADCVRGLEEAESVTSVGNLLIQARAMADVLFVGPPPVREKDANARLKSLSGRLGSTCADLGVGYVPTIDGLTGNEVYANSLTRGDGWHPDEAGYAVWADFVWEHPETRNLLR